MSKLSTRKNILHICGRNKIFVPTFIEFVKLNDSSSRHVFFIYQNMDRFSSSESLKIIQYPTFARGVLRLIVEMYKSDKIMIHGLFGNNLLQLLFIMPWILKKCYWFIWGGDLYYRQLRNSRGWLIKELLRKQVIRNIGHFVTYIKGDYDLARKWYGVRGEYHECVMYPSNLYKAYTMPARKANNTNILIGNSADPTNNHLEVLEKLEVYKEKNITIFVPLSYGDQEYAKRLVERGKEMFGEKFMPLMDFMPIDRYLGILAEIDIAVFNHKRQQAMGNTISLLGLGKKVYIRTDVTPWDFFREKNISVFDVSLLDLEKLSAPVKTRNMEIIRQIFSKEVLVGQLKRLFA